MGLPAAPEAVIRIVPVRDDRLVLLTVAQVMVPVLVPLDPLLMESQLPPDVMDAVHDMDPVPILEMLIGNVPASFDTDFDVGETDRVGLFEPDSHR